MILTAALPALSLVLVFASCEAPGRVATTCRHRIGVGADDVSAALNTRTGAERTVPGDAQTCEFVNSQPDTVDVSVRPGMGRVTVMSWADGRMPLAAVAVAGIGDHAVWQPQLHEMIAEENDLLCDVTVNAGDWKGTANSLRDRAGTLCTIVFASARAGKTPVAGNPSTRR